MLLKWTLRVVCEAANEDNLCAFWRRLSQLIPANLSPVQCRESDYQILEDLFGIDFFP